MDEKIFNRIKVMVEKTYYISQRYSTPSTFALIFHSKVITPDELGHFVRKSDHFIRIDDHFTFMNFEFTTQEVAFKAAQNLTMSLDNFFSDNASKIAIDTFDTNNSPHIVYTRLQQILKEIQKDPYSRIDDENVLNGII